VLGANSRSAARTTQHLADPVDAEPAALDDTLTALVDVGHDHFRLRSSSAAAETRSQCA
jgi:hypothetical protein